MRGEGEGGEAHPRTAGAVTNADMEILRVSRRRDGR